MAHHELLRDLLILFGFATLIGFLLQRARQSTIVAYLLTGLLVGPSGLRLITSRQAIELMAEIGVALLLFTIGIEFSLDKLLRMRQVILGAGGLQVALTILAVLVVAVPLGLNWKQGLLWGFLIAASSTAIVLKLLFERQELESPHGRIILGILIFQDICVVPMMAIVPALAAPAATLAWELLAAISKSTGVVILTLGTARYLFPWLWRHIAALRNKEIFLLATIFFSLGTAWGVSLLGLSLALGAFLAGLALSESEYAHQILSEILPFRDSFSSLFFISVGMLLDLDYTFRHGWIVLALGIGVVLAKIGTGAAAALSLGFRLRVALLVGLALAQVGEFSFVLIQQTGAMALVGEAGYQSFLSVAVFSMILTPLLIQASPRVATHLSELRALQRVFRQEVDAESAQVTRSLRDHVIVCGYGLSGRLTAGVLRRLRLPYVVLETNPATVRSARALGENILFGDCSHKEILSQAGAERARAVVFATSDPFMLARAVANARSLNQALHVIARTKRLEDSPELERAGADKVVSEELEAAQEIIAGLLNLHGIPRKEAFAEIDRACSDVVPDEVTRHSGS